MTAGTLVFYAGIAVLAAAVLLSIILIITGPGSKRKIRERMKEKY